MKKIVEGLSGKMLKYSQWDMRDVDLTCTYIRNNPFDLVYPFNKGPLGLRAGMG